MTLTIELSPESEARLRARAAAAGADLAKLVTDIVESNLQQPGGLSALDSEQEQHRLRAAVEDSLQRVKNLEPDPNRSRLTGQKAEIEELIVQKFRKQGLVL